MAVEEEAVHLEAERKQRKKKQRGRETLPRDILPPVRLCLLMLPPATNEPLDRYFIF